MPNSSPSANGPNAYVVVQRGSARLEVVPLSPETRITVGRAPSNRIVINDPKCSRQHCEFFTREGRWFVRDLDSRNGITVDGLTVDDDWELEIGQAVGVGGCALLFTDREPGDAAAIDDSGVSGTVPFAVIERKTGTRFDPPVAGQHVPLRGRHGVAELFRLAQAMTSATSDTELTDSVLEGLLSGTSADVGAILLFPETRENDDYSSLEARSVRAPADTETPHFSDYLSQLVLTDHEAFLVHDIAKDDSLSHRKSLNQLEATSAICAPIRHEDGVLGLIHLYSTNPSDPLDGDQLEFTLAVADQLSGHLAALDERQRLINAATDAQQTARELRDQLQVETELIGSSEALETVRSQVARVAPTDATVLIRGESGVGKELVARAVHFNSQRKKGPFVCVNCAALTESLLESELFGHEKGAFTGAAGQKAGKFEQANQGTLFLDEIGEMNPDLQAKFLRVLEGQPFERVGGGKPITVDVRVVTATNRDLEDAVREGQFRSDLYFRLQVIEIVVPPLREHIGDVPIIAQHFARQFARKAQRPIHGFNDDALRMLSEHYWPGNVRELRNVVERAVILSENDVLTPRDISLSKIAPEKSAEESLDSEVDGDRPTEPGARRGDRRRGAGAMSEADLFAGFINDEVTLDDLDRRYLQAVLGHCRWNKSQAARLLGIERTTLDRRLKKYGMQRPGGS